MSDLIFLVGFLKVLRVRLSDIPLHVPLFVRSSINEMVTDLFMQRRQERQQT